MRGLDPRIHQSSREAFSKGMDGRVKPGHDKRKTGPPPAA
ncbi:MAG: ABC transporter [Alphaproteobacteria bacterium]|nr:MAG: ABC transporter [Alphaproteobacteria bacterium]